MAKQKPPPKKAMRKVARLEKRLAASRKDEKKRSRQLEKAQERTLGLTTRLAQLKQGKPDAAATVVIAAAVPAPATVVVEQPQTDNGAARTPTASPAASPASAARAGRTTRKTTRATTPTPD